MFGCPVEDKHTSLTVGTYSWNKISDHCVLAEKRGNQQLGFISGERVVTSDNWSVHDTYFVSGSQLLSWTASALLEHLQLMILVLSLILGYFTYLYVTRLLILCVKYSTSWSSHYLWYLIIWIVRLHWMFPACGTIVLLQIPLLLSAKPIISSVYMIM